MRPMRCFVGPPVGRDAPDADAPDAYYPYPTLAFEEPHLVYLVFSHFSVISSTQVRIIS